MRAWLASLVIGAALASCTSTSDTQLVAVKSARTVLAEWALAEEQGAHHRVTLTYLESIRQQARDELKSAQAQLPRPAAALVAQVMEGQPSSGMLHQAEVALAPVETQLESA